MPPRWPRKPDRNNDPDYRRLDDRMNFALHVAIYAATNSGLWFVHQIKPDTLLWLTWFSLGWLGLLAIHGIFIFVIADYTPSSNPK
ncbi:MAG: 2TM domain-containing protein [Roseofilum sp. SBFL]|uniref:2TM domain-containing protein n=1 Tax=unclassified Roseofilum TaxID=2620099 RepID=UPI001B2BAEED|nr:MULTISPECIES: 2TM domain-containing protein [unclassified Roseofilum]MBP0015012.1 2TM domain-containing protein [Roseofilum sp. SID3]MBP0024548.1 2TM domain-containing protein [Roseofilum sp. SID2]MBP0037296.1 2TM domain-containing protein [Roseofilum sp. SID1]MBP0041399.1 2TM domain-containing protein [Roseofilum sp. SBFL]